MNVGIVGLGLIGGSMARSIKDRTGRQVYGIDLDGGDHVHGPAVWGCGRGAGRGEPPPV